LGNFEDSVDKNVDKENLGGETSSSKKKLELYASKKKSVKKNFIKFLTSLDLKNDYDMENMERLGSKDNRSTYKVLNKTTNEFFQIKKIETDNKDEFDVFQEEIHKLN